MPFDSHTRQSDRPWTYRVEHIPAGTSPTQLTEKFVDEDRPNIKVRSLAPAVDSGKLIATISFPSSRPPPEPTDEDLEVDREFIGFTPLNYPQEPLVADIIAVTGLAGHAFGSWSSSPRQMWLRDFLPQDIPNVAIYTYGYNSRLQNAPSRSIISDHARRFVDKLAYLRSTNTGPPRPLILIGHSLGGLIIKKAICELQNSNSPDYQSDLVLPCVMFLGTPHRGLETEALATLVKQEPSRDIVEELRPDSPTIRDLNDQFRRVASHMNIVTCYELVPTPTVQQGPDGNWARTGAPILMVKHDSAVLGTQYEVAIPCQSNHSELAKLKRGEAGDYTIIAGHIRRALRLRRSTQSQLPSSLSQMSMQTQTPPQSPPPESQKSKALVKATEASSEPPPLWSAAMAGNLELLHKTIASGADVESKYGPNARTALGVAASQGDQNLVVALIEAQANLNVKDSGGLTPLHLAADMDRTEAITALIKAGADKESTNASGETPLMQACVRNKPRAVQALIDAGANFDYQLESRTPLYRSSVAGFADVVQILLKAGANKDTPAKGGWSPLHAAVSNKHTNVAKMLLNAGANPQTKNENGNPVLSTAILREVEEIIPLIIKALHGEVNAKGIKGRTALHAAGEKNDVDAAFELMRAGAFIEVPDVDGWRPLHLAVNFKSEEVARILVVGGASAWAKTNDGRDAIDIARGHDLGPLADFLFASAAPPSVHKAGLFAAKMIRKVRDL